MNIPESSEGGGDTEADARSEFLFTGLKKKGRG